MTEKEIVQYAVNYIKERSSVSQTKLDYYLDEWKYNKPQNLESIYKSLLNSAKNSGGMPNFIGEVEKLEPFLFNYSPKKITENYGDWGELFDEIYNSNYTTPSKMIKNEIRNSWVKYCKSIIDSAKFFSRFNNYEDFNIYTNQFIIEDNIDIRIALPLIMKEEIYNVGFALACDFIKENVSPKFIKPDVHINSIFKGIGICDTNDSDYEIFRKVIIFSKKADQEPYWIDKLFWLIGSGRFYKTEKYPFEDKFKTSRNDFIFFINDNANHF